MSPSLASQTVPCLILSRYIYRLGFSLLSLPGLREEFLDGSPLLSRTNHYQDKVPSRAGTSSSRMMTAAGGAGLRQSASALVSPNPVPAVSAIGGGKRSRRDWRSSVLSNLSAFISSDMVAPSWRPGKLEMSIDRIGATLVALVKLEIQPSVSVVQVGYGPSIRALTVSE